MGSNKSSLMLKYQKAKVKLLEYEVHKKEWQILQIIYRDLNIPKIIQIKKYKEEEYGLQKKEKFDMEGRILSFCCGTAGFWRDLCGDPHRGADPESGQCTAS